MSIIRKETDRYEERRGNIDPCFIILHYTDTRNLQEAEDILLGRIEHPEGSRVSVHYMIDRDGTTIQYVDEDKRAWHAGVSYWDRIIDINSHSIGVELVNPGERYGYEPFPEAQMQALVALCKDIQARHDISPYRVLGHSDIAPTRKTDPGYLFDWSLLGRKGIAVWPDPDSSDKKCGQAYIEDEGRLRTALIEYGYDPKVGLESLITAFQRHFTPMAFRNQGEVGVITQDMATCLSWLVRTKPDFPRVR